MVRPIVPLMLALLLAACASRQPTPVAPAESEPVTDAHPATGDSAVAGDTARDAPARAEAFGEELLFHLLRGELAGSQGDLRRSLDGYLQASRLSGDPRVAEQAARLALYLRDHPAAFEAATRWRQLDPDDPAPREVLALVALRAGQLETATAHLRAVLQLDPAGVGSGFERIAGLLARETGDTRSQALTAVRALVAEHPTEPQAHQSLGELALRLEQPALALEAADAAKALDPDWTAPDLLKVRAYLEAGEGARAADLLDQVLRREPDDYDLRLQYARTLLGLERTEGALQQFEMLLKARPDDAQIRYVVALLALELGEHDKARKYLLQLVNGGQRADDAYFYLGRLAQAEGDHKGALRWYRRVQGQLRPDALLRVAALLAEQGQPEAAYAQLRDVRQQYPSAAAQSYLLEAGLLRRDHKLAAALALYDEALALYPDNRDLRHGRALTAAMLDRIDEAERDFRRLLAQDPDDPRYLNALGYTLVDRTTRYQEGYELIRKAYALRPDDPAIIDSMGWAMFRLGRLEEAQAMLEQAYELAPEGEIAAHLAEVLWQLGQRRQAKRILADALRAEPKHQVLLETRKRLQ